MTEHPDGSGRNKDHNVWIRETWDKIVSYERTMIELKAEIAEKTVTFLDNLIELGGLEKGKTFRDEFLWGIFGNRKSRRRVRELVDANFSISERLSACREEMDMIEALATSAARLYVAETVPDGHDRSAALDHVRESAKKAASLPVQVTKFVSTLPSRRE